MLSSVDKTQGFMLNIMNNFSSTDTDDHLEEFDTSQPLSRTVQILLAVFLITAIVIGTIGNITVLVLFIKYKSLRTISNIFVVNLTGTDLMICIVCLPSLIIVFLRGRKEQTVEIFFCNVDAFLGAFAGFLSIWSLVCLAADRCIVIRRDLPIRYSSDKPAAIIAMVGAWILALVGACLPFMGFGQFVLKGTTISCETSDSFSKSVSNIIYNILIQLVFFFIPIICITSCYIVIYRKVKHHEKRYFDCGKDGKLTVTAFRRTCRRRKLERNELKTAKAGLILITVFCFSWAPYSIIYMIGLFGERATLTPLAVAIPALFAKVSTTLNPLVYALLLQSFKSKLKFCCKKYFSPAPSSYGSWERTNLNLTQRPKYSVVVTSRRHSSVTAL